MAITDVPILSMLRTRMSWNQERQKVLAQNVANADTPNYRGRELVAPKFKDSVAVATSPVNPVVLAATEPGHIGGSMGGSSAYDTTKGGYEIRPTGNAVNLEDEMMKVASNQMEYQAATALYTRSLDLLKVALGKK
jgi:flagellar basal-body rod protein FlgB